MPNDARPPAQSVPELVKTNIDSQCTCCCGMCDDCDHCVFYKYHGQDIARAFLSQEAELARLRGVLQLVSDFYGFQDANANETFERIADWFYADTGFLRPGKDEPAALHSDDRQEKRALAWSEWCNKQNLHVKNSVLAALPTPKP